MGLAAAATDQNAKPDFSLLFEACPGYYVVFAPDLTVLAASNTYLRAIQTPREALIGRSVEEIFDAIPEDATPFALPDLKASLQRVLDTRITDAMPLQRCILHSGEGDASTLSCWSGFNMPVLQRGKLMYILHCMEDVTELSHLKQRLQASQPTGRGGEATIINLARELGETNQRLREEHHETTRLLSAIIDSSAEAIISTNVAGIITSWNKSAEQLFGYSAMEAIGESIAIVFPPELREEERHILQRVNLGERIHALECIRLHKDGRRLPVSTNISPLFDELGRVVGSSRVIEDTSGKREAEKTREQLRQAQKMEAIGQLTGGIAHDFNNLLAVILGNLDLMSEQLGSDHPLNEFIQPGLKAAEHGAELTRQLLAFGRKQTLQPKTISVNELLHGFLPLVRRTLGAQVEISFAPAIDLWNVHVDPNQLQNALLNLSVNARDAMPQGGKLIYETANCILEAEYTAQYNDLTPGDYVTIAVSDTGSGMNEETIAKAFEPFFTTKEVGKGTGLGLSMVYGFVKQSRGHIRIYSELGQGTSIKIYLPRTQASLEAETHVDLTAVKPNKQHTILVVDDSREVLKVTGAMVRKLGYKALTAEYAAEALVLLEKHPEIDLMLTDVMLPGGINGPALAQKALQLRPGLKILFNSGYAEHAIIQSGLLKEGVHLISKPFRRQQLGEKLMDLLYNQPVAN